MPRRLNWRNWCSLLSLGSITRWKNLRCTQHHNLIPTLLAGLKQRPRPSYFPMRYVLFVAALWHLIDQSFVNLRSLSIITSFGFAQDIHFAPPPHLTSFVWPGHARNVFHPQNIQPLMTCTNLRELDVRGLDLDLQDFPVTQLTNLTSLKMRGVLHPNFFLPANTTFSRSLTCLHLDIPDIAQQWSTISVIFPQPQLVELLMHGLATPQQYHTIFQGAPQLQVFHCVHLSLFLCLS